MDYDTSLESRLVRPDARRYLKLLPLDEVKTRIRSAFRELGTEMIAANEALGRVAAETVRSTTASPENPTCVMDGYAIRSNQTESSSAAIPARFVVKTRTDPGARGLNLKVGPNETIAVSTGSPLPPGADAVARVEETKLEGTEVVITRKVPRWKNVALRGEDFRKGQVLLKKGEMVNPATLALLITAGPRRLLTFRRPKVGVLSIGRGLKSFGDSTPGKKVNNYCDLITGFLSEFGVQGASLGVVVNDPTEIARSILSSIDGYDMIITIGGSSVGRGDFAPDALLLAGNSSMIFHGVRAVPIRPAGLARVHGKPIPVVPAHFTSATLSFFAVVLPTLNQLTGLPIDSRMPVVGATATDELVNDRGIDALRLVSLGRNGAAYYAKPLRWGSNLSFDTSRANGFVRLKPRERISPGQPLCVNILGGSEFTRIQ